MSPLVPPALGWLVGLTLVSMVTPDGWATALAMTGLATGLSMTVWGLVPRAAAPAREIAPWVVAAVAGLLAGAAAGAHTPTSSALPPEGMVRLQVRVIDTRHGHDRVRSVVRVIEGKRLTDAAPVAPGTLLSVAPHPLQAGATLRLVGKLRPVVRFRNPSPHPPAPPRHPVAGRLWLPDPAAAEIIASAPFGAALARARERVRHALDTTLAPPARGIARALVLGEAGAVTEQDAARVRAAGLAHVLAVSGLHVALLSGMLVGAIRRVLLWTPLALRHDPARIACALGVPLALLHALFAGGGPSAMRAATTAAIAWVLGAAGLRPRPGAVAALAVLALGALDPAEAARPGFVLSIAATAAILTARVPAGSGVGAWLRAGFVMSVRTTLATAPVVLWCFGQVPLVGLLANVIVVPLAAALLLPTASLHALLATLSPELGAPTAAVLSQAAGAFLAACGFFAALLPEVAWPVPDVWQGLTLALSAGALLLCRRIRSRLLVIALTAVALIALEARLQSEVQPRGLLRVTFLDVGQGDAALVDLPDGRAVLIDAGGSPNGGPDPGRAVVSPLLAALRRNHLDVVVLSHPHPDHYGGLAHVLEQVSVGELWDSGQAADEVDMSPTAAEAQRLIDRAVNMGVRLRRPDSLCGEPMRAAGATVRVLAPCPGYDSGHGANDNSLVVRIDHGERSFLFTGDAEAHAEARLLQRARDLRADVLKVGHHGSRTSTTPGFLAAVRPALALISAGAVNPFGHPHQDVRARLERTVPHVLSLAEVGGTVVESDGRQLSVRTWSGLRLSPRRSEIDAQR